MARVTEQKNIMLEHMYHKPLINPDELLETLHEYRDIVKPYVCDVSLYLNNAIKEGKTILVAIVVFTMIKQEIHGTLILIFVTNIIEKGLKVNQKQ